MPNLSIKDVPEALAEALRQRAARNHRSLQGELMALLEETVGWENRVAEPAVKYATPPVSHEEYVRRLTEIAAQVNPHFSAADRLTRAQVHDRAYLQQLGI
ncbi:MAG: Arc family DNA-binding protein [Rhodocyclaceae bacterium]|nr:Arc family DNA-binding protein [Rhodocyclaceae bacterium]MDZ4215884.1 Arc family DNA-binding protein [Rhodocyclaceae bacterium]